MLQTKLIVSIKKIIHISMYNSGFVVSRIQLAKIKTR